MIEKDSKDIIKGLGELNKRFSGKRVILTGSAGFLGCQFMHYFFLLNNSGILDTPCVVYSWDNYFRGYPKWMDQMKQDPNFIINKRDIIKDKDFPETDFIIHAASIASPTYYRKHPIETIDANVSGLRNLLDFCSFSSIESMLYFSTSEIYGDPDSTNIPTKEEYRGNVSCTGPRACYDESKRLGETLCVNFWQIHKVPVKIARPFNNYGPGLNPGDKRVLPDFFSNIMEGENIKILSNGNATRTFCYISDAMEGYIRLLLSDYNGDSFNIGTAKPEISIRDLAKKVISVTKSEQKVIYSTSKDQNYLIDNPQRRCPSIAKAEKLLGFRPKISLEEGLLRSFEYYSNKKKLI